MTDLPQPGRRVIVVGTSGSGKSTLAAELARRLGCEHTELDALHWEENWTEAEEEVFRDRVRQVAGGESWVADGNYGKVRDVLWPRADTLVWLDYPRPVIMWRLLWRTLARTLGGRQLWNGNRERFSAQFLSKQSLFLWAWNTQPLIRQRYPALLKQPEHAHLRVVRLRTPGEAERWLAEVRMVSIAVRDTSEGTSGV